MDNSAAENAKTVLCVDDEERIIVALRRLLHGKYRVVAASDGESAIEQVAKEEPDLIILDVRMPGMSGFEVMDHLREKDTPDIPIIMLTGAASAKDIAEGYSRGSVLYITKPFRKEHLLNAIDYLIGDLTEEERQALEARL